MHLTRLLGIDKLSPDLIKSVYIVVFINIFRILASNIFIIVATLHFIDTLDPLQVAAVWGMYFTTMAILDYPTGNLGDAIGYKKLLIIAYIVQIAATPLIVFGKDYITYMIFMFFFALGISQESGALEAWFDNLYKEKAKKIDPNREIFTDFIARISVVYRAFSITGFVSGGFISTLGSRQIVFIVFWALLGIILISILVAIPADVKIKGLKSVSDFGKQIKKSFSVFIGSRIIFFYFIGVAIIWAVNESIWFTYMLFKMYRDYSGSDAGAGVIRAMVYLSGLLWQLLVIKIIKYFKNSYFWVFFATLVSNALFFVLIFIYYRLVPPAGFDFWTIVGFLLIYQIPSFWEALQGTLQSRISLDLIPSEYRNALYSLLPTLARAFGIPFVAVTGWLINRYGFESSFYWVTFTALLGSGMLGLGLLVAPKPVEAHEEKEIEITVE